MPLKIRYNAPVVLTFALLCTGLYFLNDLLNNGLSDLIMLSPGFDFGYIPDYISLVGHTLGHADLDHLLGNMTFILLIGPILEEKYGGRDLLGMMIITALVTALLNLIFFSSGLMGASGIVFMFILLVSFTGQEKGGIPISFILIVLLFIGKEVVSSFQQDNISQFAHIMGGIAGSVFGFLQKPGNESTLKSA